MGGKFKVTFSIYENWRKQWDQGTNECFKSYCDAVDNAESYQELREIIGKGLTDDNLSTGDLELVITRARAVKTLKGFSP